jgi:putative ABC transport system substrate-binding protein
VRGFPIADWRLPIGLKPILILSLAFGMFSVPFVAEAQQTGKVARVGILCVGICPPVPLDVGPNDSAFVQGLREAGYIDGQNLSIDFRGIGSSYDQLPALVAGLVQRKVDVIVALGSPASVQAAKNATSTIPIVMVGVADAVELGLVASLARPGGNITGLTVPFTQLAAKQLGLLKEAAPRLSRVAVLWNPGAPLGGSSAQQIEVSARSLGVQVQPVEVRDPRDFERAFSTITQQRSNGLFVTGDLIFSARRGEIALFALKSRMPMISSSREFADAGGLMTYGPSGPELFRRAATFVGKILNGAKPSALPVEEPVRYELIINLATAKALGLTIPQSLLLRMDQVIE